MKTYLTTDDLAKRYRVTRSNIWRWKASGRLPEPIKFSPGCTRWDADEIEAHDARLLAGRASRPNEAA